MISFHEDKLHCNVFSHLKKILVTSFSRLVHFILTVYAACRLNQFSNMTDTLDDQQKKKEEN